MFSLKNLPKIEVSNIDINQNDKIEPRFDP